MVSQLVCSLHKTWTYTAQVKGFPFEWELEESAIAMTINYGKPIVAIFKI